MGAPWAVLGIATLSQTLPGITKASTWLTKPRVPCASFSHAPVQHPPCLGGHHPPPLLPYQEEAVLPKHVPKTLKLSGYCYIIRSSCPAPSLEPRTHPTPQHSRSHLPDHRDNTGGGKAGWAWWKAAQHQCQHGTQRSQVRAAYLQGRRAGARGPRGCPHFRV